MTDPAILAVPPVRSRKLKTPRTGPVAAWLAWSSLRLPGLWRLRVDIALPMHAAMLVAALAAPFLFLWMSGSNPNTYCGQPTSLAVLTSVDGAFPGCTDYITFSDNTNDTSYIPHQYTYYSGFGASDLGLIIFFYVLVSLGLALTWLFYVCRSVRLREVVPVNNRPALLPVFGLLVLFTVWPVLAQHSAFAFTHDGGLGTLLTGTAEITRDDGQVRKIFAPNAGYDNAFSAGFLIMGLVLSLFIAVCTKLLVFDGLTGLLRAVVVAAIASAVTASILYLDGALGSPTRDLFSFIPLGSISSDMMSVAVCGLPAAVFLYLAYKKDVWRGVRRPATRTYAMAFALYAPGWMFFPVYTVAAIPFVNPAGGGAPPALAFFPIILLLALIAAFILRGVARLSLLPRP